MTAIVSALPTIPTTLRIDKKTDTAVIASWLDGTPKLLKINGSVPHAKLTVGGDAYNDKCNFTF